MITVTTGFSVCYSSTKKSISCVDSAQYGMKFKILQKANSVYLIVGVQGNAKMEMKKTSGKIFKLDAHTERGNSLNAIFNTQKETLKYKSESMKRYKTIKCR